MGDTVAVSKSTVFVCAEVVLAANEVVVVAFVTVNAIPEDELVA